MTKRSRTSTRGKSRGSTSKPHATLKSSILQLCQRPHIRLMGNGVGAFAVGQGRDRRWFSGGLGTGTSDIIGWKREDCFVPAAGGEMIVTSVARFAAIEIKTGTGRLTPEQARFLEDVRAAGGIAGVARSLEDAMGLLGLG